MYRYYVYTIYYIYIYMYIYIIHCVIGHFWIDIYYLNYCRVVVQ